MHRIGRVGRAGREGTAITLVEPREHRMLKTIERATGQPIAIEKLPTVADLRTRRLELTRAALRESLLKDDLDTFRVVVEPLERGVRPLRGGARRRQAGPRGERHRRARKKSCRRSTARRRMTAAAGARPPSRDQRRDRRAAGGHDTPVRRDRPFGRSPARRTLSALSPASRYLSGRDIGAIEIADRFSLVEVPESAADDVIAALRQASIKGRKATVRRERYPAR